MITTPASTTDTAERTALGPLWRTGLVAAVAAAAANTALVAGARGVDIALETVQDEPIPLLGFTQLTFTSVVVGLLLASVLARKARTPRATFTRTAVALTAVSCVPALFMISGVASIVVTILTHVVAAAIVIPPVRDRLPR